MGTIVDDPVDFYSTRVPKKQQKKTILEELIDDAKIKKSLPFQAFLLVNLINFKIILKVRQKELLDYTRKGRKTQKTFGQTLKENKKTLKFILNKFDF